MAIHGILGCLLFLLVIEVNARTDYMANMCGQTLEAGSSGGQLDSQLGIYYSSGLDCSLTITADPGRQLLLTFNRLDIEEGVSSCSADKLLVSGSDSPADEGNLGEICGSSASDIVSTSGTVTLRFQTDSSLQQTGFLIVYTSFTSSDLLPCKSDEFECDNKRCIDLTLKSDGYDNCGDSSDDSTFSGNDFGDLGDAFDNAFRLGVGILIGIIVGCIVGVVLICVCVGCLCYHCCCKKSPAPQKTTYQVVTQNPQQQQPPMAMQPAGQPGQPAPYGQQPAYPPQQAAYPPQQQAPYPGGQPAPYGDVKA